jgi:hypothetical protein
LDLDLDWEMDLDVVGFVLRKFVLNKFILKKKKKLGGLGPNRL